MGRDEPTLAAFGLKIALLELALPAVTPTVAAEPEDPTLADASEAVLLILFGVTPRPLGRGRGLSPGRRTGMISFANSLTNTAPSPPPRLKPSTTPNNPSPLPYFSTMLGR